MDDLLLLLFPSSIPIFPLLHKRQWLRCQSLQKNVSKWSAALTSGETTDSIFFCAMRRVSVTKEGGVMGMLFQTGEVKAQFFVLLVVYNVFRRSLSVGH